MSLIFMGTRNKSAHPLGAVFLPHPRVDALCGAVNDIVEKGAASELTRPAVFDQILDRALTLAGGIPGPLQPRCGMARSRRSYSAVRQMSEPWYCCAEPTGRQKGAY
jgi:hypothetical protein